MEEERSEGQEESGFQQICIPHWRLWIVPTYKFYLPVATSPMSKNVMNTKRALEFPFLSRSAFPSLSTSLLIFYHLIIYLHWLPDGERKRRICELNMFDLRRISILITPECFVHGSNYRFLIELISRPSVLCLLLCKWDGNTYVAPSLRVFTTMCMLSCFGFMGLVWLATY